MNDLHGDAETMSSAAVGGNDRLEATGSVNTLTGDASSMFSFARGGNDTLIVHSQPAESNTLYGDASGMFDNARGGNDLLIGGIGNDLIVGDAAVMSSTAQGGDDRLWGDPQGAASDGNDTFLFAGLIGRDLVFDFRDGEDLLDLLAYGFDPGSGSTLADLDFTVAGGNTTIDVGTSFALSGPGLNTIRLLGFDDLDATDFVTT
jgi:hypothetical protein